MTTLVGTNVVDFATLTVSSAVVNLIDDASPSLTAGATVRRALITVEDDQIRWRADGENPSSSEGHRLNSGDVLDFTGANFKSVLKKIKFIRVTSNAKLKITYFE